MVGADLQAARYARGRKSSSASVAMCGMCRVGETWNPPYIALPAPPRGLDDMAQIGRTKLPEAGCRMVGRASQAQGITPINDTFARLLCNGRSAVSTHRGTRFSRGSIRQGRPRYVYSTESIELIAVAIHRQDECRNKGIPVIRTSKNSGTSLSVSVMLHRLRTAVYRSLHPSFPATPLLNRWPPFLGRCITPSMHKT